MDEHLKGRAGYRSFWWRAIGTIVFIVIAYGWLDIVRIRQATGSGIDLTAITLWTIALTFAAFLILWGASGLRPWSLMNSQRTTAFVAQKNPALENAISEATGGQPPGAFYYVVAVSDTGISMFARNYCLLELTWQQVREIRASTTPVRGLDLQCVDLEIVRDGRVVTIPLQLVGNPWRAIFPVNPMHSLRIANQLEAMRTHSG